MGLLNGVEGIIEQKRQGKPVVGCFPLYPPVELFASMGLLPVVLWNLKSSVRDLMIADKHVQAYACAIGRELVQFVISESGSLLDGIYSYNACDTLRNTPEILALVNEKKGRDIPFLRMHVPQVNRAHTDAGTYIENEIKMLIEATEKAFGVSFSASAFRQTTKRYTEMRSLCLEAEKRVAMGALSFIGFCDVVLSNYFLPVEEQIEALESLINQSIPDQPKSGAGILLSGIMPPPTDVCRAIESSGMTVVANDIASLKRSYTCDPPVTDDPSAYYIDFFNNRFPCTTLLYQTDERLEAFLNLVEKSGAEGVIFSGEKFCEYEYFEFPFLDKRLKEMGIPVLFLEFGVDDFQNISAYTTRVEAFAEVLHS